MRHVAAAIASPEHNAHSKLPDGQFTSAVVKVDTVNNRGFTIKCILAAWLCHGCKVYPELEPQGNT